MKKILHATAFLLFISLSCFAQEKKPGEVVVDYDRFKDITTIRIRPFKVAKDSTSELNLSAIIAFDGHTKPKPDYVTLQLISTSSDWKFSINREFILLLDGERLLLGQIGRDFADVLNGMALESMVTVVNYGTFQKIVGAKKLEGRIGRTEFEVDAEGLKSLREFLNKIQP